MFMSPPSGKKLNKNSVHGKAAWKLLLSKKNIWNILQRDKRKIELFSLNEKCYVRRKENKHKNLSHLWNMRVVVSWFRPVLLNLGHDSLQRLLDYGKNHNHDYWSIILTNTENTTIYHNHWISFVYKNTLFIKYWITFVND